MNKEKHTPKEKSSIAATVIDGQVVASGTNADDEGGWIHWMSPEVAGWISAGIGEFTLALGEALPGNWQIALTNLAGRVLASTTLNV